MGTITAGYPMQIVAADLLGPLPESDYFTRWMEAFPLPNQDATTVANKLVDEVFLRFCSCIQTKAGNLSLSYCVKSVSC